MSTPWFYQKMIKSTEFAYSVLCTISLLKIYGDFCFLVNYNDGHNDIVKRYPQQHKGAETGCLPCCQHPRWVIPGVRWPVPCDGQTQCEPPDVPWPWPGVSSSPRGHCHLGPGKLQAQGWGEGPVQSQGTSNLPAWGHYGETTTGLKKGTFE